MVASALNSHKKWEKSSPSLPLNLRALSECRPSIAVVPVCVFNILLAACEVAGCSSTVVVEISAGVDVEAKGMEGVGGRETDGIAVGTVGAKVSGMKMGSDKNNIADFIKSFDNKV